MSDAPAPQPEPVMFEAQAGPCGWTVLPSFAPVADLGMLAVNTFLLKGREPLLVDTGLPMLTEPFLAALESQVDPADLRWIWISHADPDHVGSLAAVLARAPKARVLTAPLGAAKLGLLGFDPERVQVIEPGRDVEVAGRRLTPLRPTYYDAPETTGFIDDAGALYAVDSFGALLPAVFRSLEAIEAGDLRDGMAAWSSVDAPWLAGADREVLGRALQALKRMAPRGLLTAHLPMGEGRIDPLVDLIHDLWCAGARPAPDPVSAEAVAAVLQAA